MKCYIHATEEANGVCKACGQGMCLNCITYGKNLGYTNMCPSCIKSSYISEVGNINYRLKAIKKTFIKLIAGVSAYSILVVAGSIAIKIYPMLVALAFDGVFAWYIYKNVSEKTKLTARKNYLQGEIDKINKAEGRGQSVI